VVWVAPETHPAGHPQARPYRPKNETSQTMSGEPRSVRHALVRTRSAYSCAKRSLNSGRPDRARWRRSSCSQSSVRGARTSPPGPSSVRSSPAAQQEIGGEKKAVVEATASHDVLTLRPRAVEQRVIEHKEA